MTEHRTPKGDQRRAAFIAVATRLFLEKGFEGVSVNEVVKQAGGSLATLYAYFPTKQDILLAIARQESLGSRLPELQPEFDDRDVEDNLTLAGMAFVARIGNPQLIGLFRIMITAAPRFKEETRVFLNERRGSTIADFKDYFDRQCLRGTLQIEDTEFAAVLFTSLIRGTFSIETLMGADEFFEPAYLEKAVREAVRMFMARFGTKQTRSP
jgi:AcrR family transcriptional regulator